MRLKKLLEKRLRRGMNTLTNKIKPMGLLFMDGRCVNHRSIT